MPSEDSGVNKQESTSIVLSLPEPEAAAAPSLSTRPFTPPPPPSANANELERAGLSQSQCVLTSITSCFSIYLWRL